MDHLAPEFLSEETLPQAPTSPYTNSHNSTIKNKEITAAKSRETTDVLNKNNRERITCLQKFLKSPIQPRVALWICLEHEHIGIKAKFAQAPRPPQKWNRVTPTIKKSQIKNIKYALQSRTSIIFINAV